MSAVSRRLKQFLSGYGYAAMYAVLLHAVLFVALISQRFTPVAEPISTKPIMSYLYHPPALILPAEPTDTEARPAEVSAPEAIKKTSVKVEKTQVKADISELESNSSANKKHSKEPVAVTDLADKPLPGQGASLAQRAFNKAASLEPAVIDQAATVSYQKHLRSQQQPKLTVAKQHQELSVDPAKQVVATLYDGRQMLRTKDGCRIGDPTKHDFDALMAATKVPCGAEVSTDDLLNQALQKHSKR